MQLESPEFEALILQAASLRGEKKFKEMIDLIEGQWKELDNECHLNALMQLHYAAREAAFNDPAYRPKAVEYATRLRAIDKDIPSAKLTVDDWGQKA